MSKDGPISGNVSTLILNLPEGAPACDGKFITFRSPVDSTSITSVSIYGTVYSLVGANGSTYNGTWTSGAMITIILDHTNTKAYVVNQYIDAAASTHKHSTSEITSGTLAIARGGTGVSSMVGTDYTTNRPRGIILQATEPDSVANGCIVGVYE